MSPELPELQNIIYSGQLAYGEYSRNFEKQLASYIGIEKVLCTNSFNSAFLVLIKALGLKNGDEVIASPMCCLASTQPFAVSGINLIWADIDPKTGTLDPESVRKKITNKTKAIVHNHFCGYVGYVAEIRQIANEFGLLLIDDVSEAFGSEYYGKKAGNWGADATVYSFQTVRLPNTIDGGAISFSNNEFFKQASLLRDYGIERSKFRDDLGEISPLCDINLASYGCLPSDVNSYIGINSLKVTQYLIEKQRKNAIRICEKLPSDTSPLFPVKESIPNYWVFGALSKNKRNLIAEFREKNYGISGVHLPNYNYSLFDNKIKYSGVEEFYRQFVALPCGWWVNY